MNNQKQIKNEKKHTNSYESSMNSKNMQNFGTMHAGRLSFEDCNNKRKLHILQKAEIFI